MSSHRIISCDLILYDVPTTQGDDTMDMTAYSADPGRLFLHMSNLFAKGRGGDAGSAMGLVVRSLGVNLPAPTTSFTCTRASWTAGDILRIVTPTGEWVDLTAVSGTADATQGQYGQGASTDTDLALQIKAAVNANPRLLKWISAGNSTNTLTFTAKGDTADFNGLKLVKVVTTSGVFSFTSGVAFTGGLTAASSTTTATVDLTGGQPSANDTLVIGPITITWKASGATGNQINIAGSTTLTATALYNFINAHTVLKNYVTATNAVAGIVVMTTAYATPDMAAWTLSKTGTYTPTLSGGFYPSTATLEGAGQVRAVNIR